MDTASFSQYALADHVFLCRDGEYLVMLDLKADRYWVIEARRTAGLGAWVAGWPADGRQGSPLLQRAPCAEPIPEPLAAIAQDLHARGVLTKRLDTGKDASPVDPSHPREDLPASAETAGSWFAFLASLLVARISLSMCPFERVVRRARQRKQLQADPGGGVELRRISALVEAFARYRLLSFSSRDACLFDSLALLEYLAWHGIHPDWVFGVRARPFAAHCWLQAGDVVLNDTVEHASGYTPIMRI